MSALLPDPMERLDAITIEPRLAYCNVGVFSICLALSQTGVFLFVVVSGLGAYALTGEQGLATLPLAMQFVGTAMAVFPVAQCMHRFGRRAGFITGQLIGAASGLGACWALIEGSFWGLNLAAVLFGIHNASWNFMRFAASETAYPAFRSTAIALVLGGGILAAWMGPVLAGWSETLWLAVPYGASFAVIAGLCLLASGLLLLVRMPAPPSGEIEATHDAGVGHGSVWLAMVVAAVSFSSMAFLMNATPLAMHLQGFASHEANRVIQFHMLGMFAPSFFAGPLLRKIGCQRLTLLGIGLFYVAVLVNLSGQAGVYYRVALTLVGIGWNFMFISATRLLSEACTPRTQARLQAQNDLIMFSSVAVATFLAGKVLAGWGWQGLNVAVLLPLSAVLLMTLWQAARERRQDVEQKCGT